MTDGPMVAELHDLEGMTDEAVHTLGQGRTVIGRIGSSKPDQAFIGIHRGTISRKHAAIAWRDGRYYIEDLGTTNGTFVNDAPVTEPRALEDGDRIRLDMFEFDFKLKS